MKAFIDKNPIFCLACIIVCSLINLTAPLAGEGDIDSTYKHAWSENSGWENYRSSYSGVTVHDTYLSGYAWAENIGWVKLGSGTGPYANTTNSNWGVNYDSTTGALSGFAWSENVRWINFNPIYGGVSIDLATGDFSGYAWSENMGFIRLAGTAQDTTVYKVKTDPKTDGTGVPAELQDAAPNNGDGNGDGVKDSLQTSVASLPSATAGESYLTVEVRNGCGQLNSVAANTYASVGTVTPATHTPTRW